MKNGGEWITGNITLTLGGEPLNLQMTVPAKPVKPTRMLPIFQQMTNAFVDMGVRAAEALDKKVSCQKGCGACCRQPVPLAEIEAYHIAELVENMSEPRRSKIKLRFKKAFEHFEKISWFDRLANANEGSNEDQRKIVMEYFYENIACPFLEDESCSIHQNRPLGCREYLVTSPAENCSHPTAETIEMVRQPVKSAQTLLNIGRSKNMKEMSFVPLVRALNWAETFPEKMKEETGENWMAQFFMLLTKKNIPVK